MEFIFSGIIGILHDSMVGILTFFTGDFWEGFCIPEITTGTGSGGSFQFSMNAEGYFDQVLPGVRQLKPVFKALGLLLATLLYCVGLIRAMLPDSDSIAESPLSLTGKFVAAAFCTANAYALIALIQAPMGTICKAIYNMDKPGISKNLDAFNGSDMFSNPNLLKDETDGSTPMRGFFDQVGAVDELVQSIIALVLLFTVGWSFIKLIIEMIERYVVMGFLFYISPLAFGSATSTIGKGVFSAYVKMLLSQYLLIMFNFVFLFVFCYAMSNEGAITKAMDTNIIIYYVLLIAWLRLGQRLDELMQSLGLSVARTGQGLGGEIIAGAALAKTTISGIGKAGKWALGTRAGREVKSAAGRGVSSAIAGAAETAGRTPPQTRAMNTAAGRMGMPPEGLGAHVAVGCVRTMGVRSGMTFNQGGRAIVGSSDMVSGGISTGNGNAVAFDREALSHIGGKGIFPGEAATESAFRRSAINAGAEPTSIEIDRMPGANGGYQAGVYTASYERGNDSFSRTYVRSDLYELSPEMGERFSAPQQAADGNYYYVSSDVQASALTESDLNARANIFTRRRG